MLTNEKSKWLALTGISIASFLGLLDLTIVNTALPAIQIDLSVTVIQLQWVMNILLLALTASMVVLGKLADIYGRRLCLYIGLWLFALSSLGAGLSPNIHWLIFFRFVQGIAIALLYTAPLALIPSIFPAHHQGRATGLLVGASSFGLALGPVIGGFIVSTLGWRWIFYINPPIVLFAFLFCWKTITESKNINADKKIDWAGFIILLITIPTLILAIVQGENWGWSSTPIISLLVLALIGIIILYQVEKRIKAPIIEFHLFANRIFLVGLAANFALALFYAVDFFLMPLYLHYIQGQPGYQIGLTLLPATAMVALISPITGRIVDKKGPKGVLMLGLVLFSISALLQAQFNSHSHLYLIIFVYILFGIGWACLLSPSLAAAMSSVPSESSGVAIGTIGTLHNLGGAIGLAIGTVIYTLQAKTVLLSRLADQHLAIGSWVNQAIANTDSAISLITTNTPLNASLANQLFHQYFLHGYSGALWLLVSTSLVALAIVTFGLKWRS